MEYDLCRHIKTSGTQCGSPALLAQNFCYYHARLYQRHAGFRHTPQTRGYLIPGQHIELAPLEDRDSIQVAISVVVNALATGQLETRRATALLYGLQLASMNAGRLRPAPFAATVVTEIDPASEDMDLALPGATLSVVTNINDLDYDPDELGEDPEEGLEETPEEPESL